MAPPSSVVGPSPSPNPGTHVMESHSPAASDFQYGSLPVRKLDISRLDEGIRSHIGQILADISFGAGPQVLPQLADDTSLTIHPTETLKSTYKSLPMHLQHMGLGTSSHGASSDMKRRGESTDLEFPTKRQRLDEKEKTAGMAHNNPSIVSEFHRQSVRFALSKQQATVTPTSRSLPKASSVFNQSTAARSVKPPAAKDVRVPGWAKAVKQPPTGPKLPPTGPRADGPAVPSALMTPGWAVQKDDPKAKGNTSGIAQEFTVGLPTGPKSDRDPTRKHPFV